ncbi:MAG: ABC transporter ATP-binding protein [Nitrospira sp.]|nr:MAG: ABC transporter ATP-binding protein [Nitrospira sp.]
MSEFHGRYAIRVEGIGKRYRVGRRPIGYRTLREAISEGIHAPFRWGCKRDQTYGEKVSNWFWALKDVSFEVRHGEVVGIIGRNGAGNSTLLKILSRITEPTKGRAEIHGRLGSLLEVGTGFHSELTGRENIYLSGAILGMKKAEIERKFDEIVSFAEVERFIDTPVKHYSSGLYLRLAFAVAAHLEPEILIVDEVLAVGDAGFQKKCLGKMGEVARHGRTVLFVSHNMGAIASLCSRVNVIDQGRLVCDDAPEVAIGDYLKRISGNGSVAIANRTDREGNQKLKFLRLTILNRFGQSVDAVPAGNDVTFELEYAIRQGALNNVVFQISFLDRMGRILFVCLTRILNSNFRVLASGTKVRCFVPNLPLAPGSYTLTLICKEEGYGDRIGGPGASDGKLHLLQDQVLCREIENVSHGIPLGSVENL